MSQIEVVKCPSHIVRASGGRSLMIPLCLHVSLNVSVVDSGHAARA